MLHTNEQPVGRWEERRLGRNSKGYRGETIDIDAVLADTLHAGAKNGWCIEQLDGGPGQKLVALKRSAGGGGPRIYISTGIHGDEPAGPLAVLHLLAADGWPENVQLWVCPCLNPAGYRLNRRENPAGIDLNREYRNPRTAETLAHVAWLERQSEFDLCLCLHEDWESHGFYIYELNPDNCPSCGEVIIGAVARVCPVDTSEVIEGRPARGGIIRPSVDPRSRPDWPEAFYLLTHKTKVSYTLEAPSDWPLKTRVAALVAGTEAAVGSIG